MLCTLCVCEWLCISLCYCIHQVSNFVRHPEGRLCNSKVWPSTKRQEKHWTCLWWWWWPGIDIKQQAIHQWHLDEMKEDLSEVLATVRSVKEVDKYSSIPIALRHLIEDAFKCKICLKAPLIAPIMSRCCKAIVGCETCVNQWYSGKDALTKTCPLCRAQRGYHKTMMLRGMDEFLVGVGQVMHPSTLDDNSAD